MGDKLVVCAALGDAAAIEDEDLVRGANGAHAVRDDEGGPPGHHAAQRGFDLALRLRIDGGGGVIQDQDDGLGQERARQGRALALATGEARAAVADTAVVAVRQRIDEAMRLGVLGRLAHDLHLRVGAPVGDAVAQRFVEQKHVLGRQRDRFAE